jgi:hypothetical protein
VPAAEGTEDGAVVAAPEQGSSAGGEGGGGGGPGEDPSKPLVFMDITIDGWTAGRCVHHPTCTSL